MTQHETSTAAIDPGTWHEGRVGLWLIGARGSIGTVVSVGLHAMLAELAPPTGCTTASEAFAGVPLPAFADLVVGGHDVSTTPLRQRAHELVESGMLAHRFVATADDALARTDAEIRPGYDPTTHLGSQADAVRRMAADITAFREGHGLTHVVVIDISSTEPILEDHVEFHDADLLTAALEDPDRALLPPSSIAALAAIESDSAYACFTPSAGLGLPTLRALATERGIPYAGQDGKTGETLLRTALAPMFMARSMRVLSWAGTNILGGGDGATLADPEAVRSKLATKTRGLVSLVGDHVVAPLHIDNVPDLGDVKTAWDHIHAEGFLSSRITTQTIWSAYDSMLAAPLILDIARLLALAAADGQRGVVPEFGFFFKDPWGSDVHDFSQQTVALRDWAHATGARVHAAAQTAVTPA
ncbi:inositol-3-phosphate synthase [Agromyces cerinus]|uniref:Myo-inositol-1-phosphate synthase n=1 Tax=Agromyces cerinus subsp. cerinus TaxID=232089 RepID=A0A1N6GIH0_9MICO|nr:inositol-3-phosphate synthase [Agromyces cerinus]SIO07329.1 myo-inositol-1-phosphate synthase [Agromyces cerinus subsp. cerinus]